jgi:hypothetical protein
MTILKVLTGAGFAVCIGLMASWPWTVGPIPQKGAPKSEYRAFQQKTRVVIGGITVAFFGSAIGSAFIMRKAKDEFRRKSSENLRLLIEGATEDIRKKHEAAQSSGKSANDTEDEASA